MSSSGIITGIGKGIGLATCKYFLERGYKIYGFNKSTNFQLKQLKNKYKDKFFFFKININNSLSIKNKIIKIFKLDKNLEFLVNNAGVRSRFSLKKLNDKEIKKVYNTNFISHVKLTREFLNQITFKNKSKNKSIVMISSIVGNLGFKDLSNYGSSKGALEAFAKSIAVEYSKYNIRVNCVAPGFIETSYFNDFKKKRKKLFNWTINRIPLKRWGKAEEVAPLIEFLVSKKSRYITGTTLFVDGGWTAS